MIKSIKSFFGSFFTYIIEMKMIDKIQLLALIYGAWKVTCYMFGLSDVFGLSDKIDPKILKDFRWLRFIVGAVGVIVFLLLIFSSTINEKVKEYIMRRRHLTGNIISKRIGNVKILDNKGKKTRYFEQIYISKINEELPLVTKISADKTTKNSNFDLSSLQLNNCIAKPYSDKKTLQILYVGEKNGNNSKKLFNYDTFFCYSIDVLNAYRNKKEDFWIINFSTYTQEYKLAIEFPKNRKIKSATLYRKESIKDGDQSKEVEKLAEFTAPIIHNNYENSVIRLKIINFEVEKTFILRWEYL